MSNKKILIVDDDADVRDLLSGFLLERGYHVRNAQTGSDALKILEEETPDMIITDLLLPGEHGLDLVRIVQGKYFIPVIVLSGVYEHKDVELIIQKHYVSAFFEKPVNLNKLLAKVRQLLNE